MGAGRPASPYAQADPMDAVRREIAIMKKLDHPNVMRLIEVLDSDDSPNLFMGTWHGADETAARAAWT